MTAIAAQISIPIEPVPVTLQTAAVMLSGLILGAKRGAISQLIYLSIGLLGMPVFANLQSGPLTVFGPTGGYLVAFPILAWLCGFVADKKWDRQLWSSILGMIVGSCLLLTIGSLWLSAFVPGGVRSAFALGFMPFFAIETIKAILIAGAMPLAWKLLSFPKQ